MSVDDNTFWCKVMAGIRNYLPQQATVTFSESKELLTELRQEKGRDKLARCE